MSFLTDASLVFIPSGYKEDKAYSIKPTDGSGDLTFARASDGTRVNSEGYVERVPWNLLQQSNTLNTTWTLGSSTISGGHTGYDGSSNAWLLSSTNTSQSYCRQTITQSGKLSFSAYAKKGTANYIVLYCVGGGDARAFFNLANGTIGTQNFNLSSSIEDVGNGWYKCSLYFDKTISDVRFYVADSDNNFNSANGSNVYIQDAQLNEGTLKPYFPTTNRQDVPRLDYSNGCPCLLLEPQRTNLLTYSDQFDNAAWTKTAISVSTNAATSPDGTANADKIIPTAVNTFHDIRSGASISLSSGLNTISIFAKKSGYDYLELGVSSNVSFSKYATCVVNLTNGTNAGTGVNSTWTINSVSVTPFGDWYRIVLVFNVDTATTTGMVFGSALPTSTRGVSFTGDGTSGIYLWGAQLEASSYPTSYIPTTSASVTRVADGISLSSIPSFNNNTEFSIYFDLTRTGVDTNVIGQHFYFYSVSPTSFNFWMHIDAPVAQIRFRDALNSNATMSTIPFEANETKKIIIKSDGTYFKTFADGTLVDTYTMPTTFKVEYFTFVAKSFNMNELLAFPTALTDDQCEYLTGNSYSTYATMASQLNYTIQ